LSISQALRGVEARLKLLAARAGLSYTLTTVSHEREVRVATSHDVTVAGHPGCAGTHQRQLQHNVTAQATLDMPSHLEAFCTL